MPESVGSKALLETLASGTSILVHAGGVEQLFSADAEREHSLHTELQSYVSVETWGMSLPSLSFHEVMSRALDESPEQTSQLLSDFPWPLSSEPKPPPTRQLLGGPWQAIYDLSGDPRLRQAVAVCDDLAAFVPSGRGELSDTRTPVYPLNGVLDTPDSIRLGVDTRYFCGESLWASQYSSDTQVHPSVLLLDSESTLMDIQPWLPSRASAFGASRFLVGGVLDERSRWLADRIGLQVVEDIDVEELANLLVPSHHLVSRGKRLAARARGSSSKTVGVELVPALARTSFDGPADDFLRGFDPAWSDIAHDRPAKLTRHEAVRASAVLDDGRRNIAVVPGRAGTGKTTALMMVALELSRSGYVVGWIDREITVRRADVLRELDDLNLDAIFIDDVDLFGTEVGSTLLHANRSGRTAVVASIRTTQVRLLPSDIHVKMVEDFDRKLEGDDFKSVVQKLHEYGRLGSLEGELALRDKEAAFERLSEGDLLAGLVQVVTGSTLGERISSEVEQLSHAGQLLYCAISLVHSLYETVSISRSHLLQMFDSLDANMNFAQALSHLLDARLALLLENESIRARHRVIAETVVEQMRSERQIVRLVELCLLYFAQRGHNQENYQPERRTMIKLLHNRSMTKLGLSMGEVRAVYAHVQDVLRDDFHYWLQRGAYDAFVGDLDSAHNYLSSARALPDGGSDPYVRTEWALVCLRRSRQAPRDPGLADEAATSLEDVVEVAQAQKERSPHSFTVAVRDGVVWLETVQNLPRPVRESLVLLVHDTLQLGREVCLDNDVFRQTARDYGGRVKILLREFGHPPPGGVPI